MATVAMGVETLELHATELEAASALRRQLVAYLGRWGCENVPNVALVCAELVSNALRYGHGASPVVVHHGEGTVRLDVYDATDRAPEIREHGDASGGFGLRIVHQLSTAWGWEPTVHGKRVWAVIPCCGEV
jgi:two-component sensor histidine kinase